MTTTTATTHPNGLKVLSSWSPSSQHHVVRIQTGCTPDLSISLWLDDPAADFVRDQDSQRVDFEQLRTFWEATGEAMLVVQAYLLALRWVTAWGEKPTLANRFGMVES